MKKLLISIGVLALLAASCNNTANNPNNGNQTQNPVQTYSNATYGFSFDYPTIMQFATPTYPLLEDKIVQLQIPQSAYLGTNFGDAAFSVSAQYAKSLTDCLKLSVPDGGDGFKTKVSINNVNFYMTKSSGVGAGNLYESNVYRAVNATGATCLELNETIHTSNIANYPPGTVTEVNKTAVQAKLDAVLRSFKFNP